MLYSKGEIMKEVIQKDFQSKSGHFAHWLTIEVQGCLLHQNEIRKETTADKDYNAGLLIGLLTLFIILLSPVYCFSNGFFLDAVDAKANGMVEAFTAQADNPSAVYFNPAGITKLDGTQFSAGITFFSIPHIGFTSKGTSVFATPGKTEASSVNEIIPSLFATQKLNSKWHIGIGAFSNFGLPTQWPDNWEGRYIQGGTKSVLETFSLNPVIAFKVSNRLSLSAGPVITYCKGELENKMFMGPGVPDANLAVDGKNYAYGYNLAAMFDINDHFTVGVSYRSKFNIALKGDIRLSGTPGGALDVKEDVTVEFELPALLYSGVAYHNGPFTLEFDVLWSQWSAYDSISTRSSILGSSVSHPNWDDSLTLRLGGSYLLCPKLELRAGIEWDESPIPSSTLDPSIPLGDLWRFSAGAGYTVGKAEINLSYNYFTGKRINYDNPTGNYDAAIADGLGRITGRFEDINGHIICLNLSYGF